MRILGSRRKDGRQRRRWSRPRLNAPRKAAQALNTGAGAHSRPPSGPSPAAGKGQSLLPPQSDWQLQGGKEQSLCATVVLLHDYAGEAAMAETAERTYSIVQAQDGTYAVQVTPHEANAPLTISGFKSEDEARAWIEAERNRALD